jgi:AraC family transcriptional regulator of adaptative response/methylated-DNA-[protein]-cysteine methyltransferase
MPATDYTRIARTMVYLEKNFRNPPDPGAAARAAGLDPSRFRRLVERWAGISPERFLGFLSVGYAKKSLLESRFYLEDSRQAGHPGTGSPRNPAVRIRAVSPGKTKGEGARLTIRYGMHDGPFGSFFLAVMEGGVCALSFLSGRGVGGAAAELRKMWDGARILRDQEGTKAVAERVFGRPGKTLSSPLDVVVKGTRFQIKVWEALVRIPPGFVVSYEDVAVRIGAPRAVRAVGSAVARNPVSYLVPCHRVIRKTGAFGNYGGGTARKKAMLALEAARRCDTIPDGSPGFPP